MGALIDQVRTITHAYVRKGGKRNRRQQARRMIAFAQFCEGLGAREIGQVGARHVVRYWRHCRHLSEATRYNHHRALVLLWRLADLRGAPPAPFSVPAEQTSRETHRDR